MDLIFTFKYFEVENSLSGVLIPRDTSATLYDLDFKRWHSVISRT